MPRPSSIFATARTSRSHLAARGSRSSVAPRGGSRSTSRRSPSRACGVLAGYFTVTGEVPPRPGDRRSPARSRQESLPPSRARSPGRRLGLRLETIPSGSQRTDLFKEARRHVRAPGKTSREIARVIAVICEGKRAEHSRYAGRGMTSGGPRRRKQRGGVPRFRLEGAREDRPPRRRHDCCPQARSLHVGEPHTHSTRLSHLVEREASGKSGLAYETAASHYAR